MVVGWWLAAHGACGAGPADSPAPEPAGAGAGARALACVQSLKVHVKCEV